MILDGRGAVRPGTGRRTGGCSPRAIRVPWLDRLERERGPLHAFAGAAHCSRATRRVPSLLAASSARFCSGDARARIAGRERIEGALALPGGGDAAGAGPWSGAGAWPLHAAGDFRRVRGRHGQAPPLLEAAGRSRISPTPWTGRGWPPAS